jgi:hypothetical protein
VLYVGDAILSANGKDLKQVTIIIWTVFKAKRWSVVLGWTSFVAFHISFWWMARSAVCSGVPRTRDLNITTFWEVMPQSSRHLPLSQRNVLLPSSWHRMTFFSTLSHHRAQ